MPCDRLCMVDRLRVTRGPDGEIIAVRGVRSPRQDRGLPRAKQPSSSDSATDSPFDTVALLPNNGGSTQSDCDTEPAIGSSEEFRGGPSTSACALGAGSNQLHPKAAMQPQSGDGAASQTSSARPGTGHAGACRSDRSRRVQRNHLLDYLAGYVLAHQRRGFLFYSLRTPTGTTVQQGHEILLRLRTALVKRFPYVDGLMLQPDLSDESLVYVSGRGWHAHWSIERSDDATPHYHLMVALYGYDVLDFVSTVARHWSAASASVLGRDLGKRPHDVHFDLELGAQTIEYMCGHKRTSSNRAVHDFSDVVEDGQGLGTKWWDVMGRPCLRLVRGHGEFLHDVSPEEIRARAVTLDSVRWGGRRVPDTCAHFRHQETGRPVYVVHGPWLGYAAQYMATGSLWALAAYRRVLLQCRERRRRANAEVFGQAFGF